jgi:hypothetical protein
MESVNVSIKHLASVFGLSEAQITAVVGISNEVLLTDDVMNAIMEYYPNNRITFWENTTRDIFESRITKYILQCKLKSMNPLNDEYHDCKCGELIDESGCYRCCEDTLNLENVFDMSPGVFPSKEMYREFCAEGAKALKESEMCIKAHTYKNGILDLSIPFYNLSTVIENVAPKSKFYKYAKIQMYFNQLKPLHDYVIPADEDILLTSYGLRKLADMFLHEDIE